ncbi:class I SAM-dependent methyltransferase [Rhodopirellula sp. MGV]|uniref:class I SAM-dependent methyltransferase n=1 Tax=Rhodopirellula sp. MGV TaxID=2023130 RepID=UPI000B964ED7|nr:class I SAM-dependent methyltransferase [Rhodopirellula sp. MGV]OYP33004.1 hypothetical protein CGZ80_19135 [Rhodopirellula sp. MGV]
MNRTIEKLRHQYDVERELVGRLKSADKTTRRSGLYSEVYNELYTRVPDHPGMTRQVSPDQIKQRTDEQLGSINPYIRSDGVYLEVGAGDCQTAMRMTELMRRVVVVEVSAEKALSRIDAPENFESVISDGVGIGTDEKDFVDIAFHNQVLEHLHPEDAVDQIRAVHDALRPGGVLILRTPHCYMGPADVSRHFSETATGMHIKEYTNAEIADLCKKIGYTRIQKVIRFSGHRFEIPMAPVRFMELLLRPWPAKLRRKMVRSPLLRPIFRIELVCQK